jgi:hypothetical protein
VENLSVAASFYVSGAIYDFLFVYDFSSDQSLETTLPVKRQE